VKDVSRCVQCEGKTKVTQTMHLLDMLMRTRICKSCGHSVNTVETVYIGAASLRPTSLPVPNGKHIKEPEPPAPVIPLTDEEARQVNLEFRKTLKVPPEKFAAYKAWQELQESKSVPVFVPPAVSGFGPVGPATWPRGNKAFYDTHMEAGNYSLARDYASNEEEYDAADKALDASGIDNDFDHDADGGPSS